MSLQTKDALEGHPKTLRDLSHVTEILTLPAAFGAIQLGQTFSGCLSVNNEAARDIQDVILKVEMQSSTAKVSLGEFGGANFTLSSNETLERIVHHEIKELGQHVLACTVSYRLPPGARAPPSSGDSQDPSIQSFRKFYKFAVSRTSTPFPIPSNNDFFRSPTHCQ